MSRALLILALAAASTACHDLPALGVCGNGIVEANRGEACDDGGASALCTPACELACATADTAPPDYVPVSEAADAPRCPAVAAGQPYACALDNICRQPSGRFAEPSPAVDFAIDSQPVAGDVDRDGIVDLAGTSTSQVVTRLGGPGDAMFQALAQQPIPASTAPPRLFAMDGTATEPPTMTLAVPTEGVAYLRSTAGEFVPELALAFELGTLDGVATFIAHDPDTVTDHAEVVMGAATTGGADGIRVLRARIPGQLDTDPDLVGLRLAPACVGTSGAPAWSLVGVLVDEDPRTFTIVARAPAGSWVVCQYTPKDNWWQLEISEVPGPPPRSFVYANVDGEPCRELVFATDTELRYLPTVAGCALLAVPVRLAQGLLVRDNILASADLVPGGPDELVLASGAYGIVAGGIEVLVQPPSNAWQHVAVVDLSGDGLPDLVASRASSFGNAVEDLDIVRGGPVLNQYRAETRTAVTRVIGGDYDGDRVGDVALLESPNGGATARLSILFGSRDQVATSPQFSTDPQPNLQALRVGRANWAVSAQTRDGTDDLVLGRGPSDALLAGFLIGDARRVPTTPRYLPLLVLNNGDIAEPRPLADIAIGRVTDDGAQSVVTTRYDDTGLVPRMGIFFSDVTQSPTENLWGGVVLNPGAMQEDLQPPYEIVRAGAGPLLAASSASNEAGFVPRVVHVASEATVCTGPSATRPITRFAALDANGDGDEELVAVRGTEAADGRVDVFDLDTCTGGTFGEPLIALSGCSDVAVLGGTVYALCTSEGDGAAVYVVDPVTHAIAAPLVVIGGTPRYLAVGDFDGDALADLAVITGRLTSVEATVLRQCAAHDVRGCPL